MTNIRLHKSSSIINCHICRKATCKAAMLSCTSLESEPLVLIVGLTSGWVRHLSGEEAQIAKYFPIITVKVKNDKLYFEKLFLH